MNQKPDNSVLYLNLLKKTLAFAMWRTVGTPIEFRNYGRRGLRRFMIRAVASILRPMKLQLVKIEQVKQDEITEGKLWPAYAHTMIGLKRLDNIQYCIENVLKDNIPGDLIETGVWRGGASIFMRGVLAAHGVTDRKVYVADSFQGLPKPDIENYPADKGDTLFKASVLAVSKKQVEDNFRLYGLLDEQVVFLEGWFNDTLPRLSSSQLAIMRLDGDLYQSTIEALENLYPKLSVGGYCIIDDYNLMTCKKAVDDFREKHYITAPLQEIDSAGRFWQKETPSIMA